MKYLLSDIINRYNSVLISYIWINMIGNDLEKILLLTFFEGRKNCFNEPSNIYSNKGFFKEKEPPQYRLSYHWEEMTKYNLNS